MITGIVLAAGASTRMGTPKQLLPLAGKPVLQHVIDAANAAPLDEIVVVLGHAALEIEAEVSLGPRARVTVNDDYAKGQSTSLKAGLRAAAEGAEAAVFLLGDQPGVRPAAIAAVVAAWQGPATPVVQASYGGRPAHPTLVDRSVWAELERVRGDEGARGVIARHGDWRRLVEVGGSPPDDVDSWDDYRRVRRSFEGDRSVDLDT